MLRQVKAIYPAIENANRQLEQFLNNRIENGQNVFRSKEVCVVEGKIN